MPRLGAFNLTANTPTIVYTAPSGKKATVTVNFCNTSDNPALVYLAMCANGFGVQSTDWIEYKTSLPPGASFERTGLTPANGEVIEVQSDTSSVTCVVWGYTE